jgi:acetyl esterase/lipase
MATYFCGRAVLCGGLAAVLAVAAAAAPQAAAPQSVAPQAAELQAAAPGLKMVRNLDYGGSANARQMLDLYLPEKPMDGLRPLIVFVHGGAWQGGSKSDGRVIFPLLADGVYAGASLGYRLTDEAIWPAQIHDCKAALRWLGQHAASHGCDAKRMVLFGISAGGHLVSLLGTSQGVDALEGRVGVPASGLLPRAPGILGVANFCGPANFLTFPGQGSQIHEDDPMGPLARFFGGPMSDHLDLAKAASPVTYITENDPPFLHIHGTNDELVPYGQAREFDAALEKSGVSSIMLTGQDAPHVFASKDLYLKLRQFFDEHLLDGPSVVTDGPVAIRDEG